MYEDFFLFSFLDVVAGEGQKGLRLAFDLFFGEWMECSIGMRILSVRFIAFLYGG